MSEELHEKLESNWLPVVKPVLDHLSDLFGARLVAGPITSVRGIWPELQPHMPETITAIVADIQGSLAGELGLIWALSDTGAPSEWSENEEARAGLWEAIGPGVTAGFSAVTGSEVTVETDMEPQTGPSDMLDSEGEPTNLVRLDASGDGISFFLGLVVSDEVVAAIEGSGAEATEEVAATTERQNEAEAFVQARPPQLGQVRPEPYGGDSRELDVVLDLPLRLTVEVGKARVLLKDVLSMGKGSVVELDRLAGDPVDVYVNGKKMAKGEIVVLPDGNFGVRIVEVLSSKDRLRNLQEN